MLLGIVDSWNQHIFHANSRIHPFRERQERSHQVRNRLRTVDGHDLGANPIVRCIQTHREIEPVKSRLRDELSVAPNARNASNGTDGDVNWRHLVGVAIGDHLNSCKDRIDVVHRFAHSHEDHILDGVTRTSSGGIANHEARGVKLRNDFGSRQAAHQSHLRGLAEAATHGASHLTGNAQGARGGAIGVAHRNDHGFRLQTVVERHGELHGLAINVSVFDGPTCVRDPLRKRSALDFTATMESAIQRLRIKQRHSMAFRHGNELRKCHTEDGYLLGCHCRHRCRSQTSSIVGPSTNCFRLCRYLDAMAPSITR